MQSSGGGEPQAVGPVDADEVMARLLEAVSCDRVAVRRMLVDITVLGAAQN